MSPESRERIHNAQYNAFIVLLKHAPLVCLFAESGYVFCEHFL